MDPVRKWLGSDPVRYDNYGPFSAGELAHELSPWMTPYVSDVEVSGRSLAEMSALTSLSIPTVDAAIHGGTTAFISAVYSLYEAIMGRRAVIRTTEVGTRLDKRGNGIIYPPARIVETRLQELATYWLSHLDTYPVLTAAVSMMAISNVHPFDDGNGRVARLLFHWTLNRSRTSLFYLPLHELAALSSCGYLIRARQAQLHGHWDPLLVYFELVGNRFFAEPVSRA
ncbi:Fic family protein [Luteibacter sp.]|uniref:Fic family protein n=1 Tax=Luteibacter sp. TaxID=1886636 RepID=UPI003F809339